MIAADTYT